MPLLRALTFTGVSLLALASPALVQSAAAQTGAESGDLDGVIIVEARRRDELLQDVPLTVNAVTADTLEKLNIRNFADLTSVVPGLSLESGLGTVSSQASLRGVQVDTNASGNNATVEFYMNDAPIGINTVLQSMYDIGQIEVLRGPQGTLRGRASPSGSITITSRRPDMQEWGGYVSGTATTLDTVNVNGAVNVPIAAGVLALRVAGLVEDNEANRVRSINAPGIEPSSKTRAIRVSGRFTPDSNLEINGSYSRLEKNTIVFDQVESAYLADSTRPVAGTEILGTDRLAVMNAPRNNHATYDVLNFQGRWAFAGQRLDYVGSHVKAFSTSQEPADKGDFFGSAFPGDSASPNQNLQNYGSRPQTTAWQQSHELRLTSEERLAGIFDYVIGAFLNRTRSDVNFLVRTPVFFGLPGPTTGHFINTTPVLREGRGVERAVFGNLTAHLGTGTEISGGARRIWYKDNSSLLLLGNLTTGQLKHSATIWTASVKHRFNESVMAYATAGSSWRIGVDTNAIILAGAGNRGTTDPFLQGLQTPTPETSKSYEIGVRTNWLDNRLTLNLSAFHQDFKNYIFSTGSIFFAAFDGVSAYRVGTVSGLALGVPAEVDGIEAEFAFQPSRNFSFGGNVAYARGRITNATVPCSPAGPTPTDTSPWDTANGQQVLTCTVNQRASVLAPFSASLQSEYSHDIADGKQAFLRGLLTYKGKSRNQPANLIDDVKAYGLLNLFAGVRATDGSWELTGFVKNVTNEKIVLTREATPYNASFQIGATPGSGFSNYRGVTMTAPREFGLTFRYAFGSR